MKQQGMALAVLVATAFGLAPALPAAADPAVIYGTVTTEDGRELSGVLSWDDEEIYWLQHFNGMRRDPVDLSGLDEATRDAILDQQPGPQLEAGGITIELVKWFSDPELRPTEFAVEFGAIDRMEIDRSEVTVHLRDGSSFVARGGSNDIGADLRILASDGSERELDWDDIEAVAFAEAPAGHPTFSPQLFGTASTAHGPLTGVMAWDSDERRATEMLDGDLDGDEVSLEFGEILRIESRGNASMVSTRDGRELLLDDSNDVDAQNRGLIIVSPVFGRIVVDWGDFEAVDFAPLPAGFLPGRSAWDGLGRLQGEVVAEGERLAGELLYDVDEQLDVDTLDGYVGRSRVWIPLRLVSVIRRGDNRSHVSLTTGIEWDLDRARDVMDTNNGVVVAAASGRRYLTWMELTEIRFPSHRPPASPAAVEPVPVAPIPQAETEAPEAAEETTD